MKHLYTVAALVLTLGGACSAAQNVVATSASVGDAGKVVMATVHGRPSVVLRACPREFFMPGHDKRIPNPRLDAGGTWLLVDRAYPFQKHGRVDESSVLYNVVTRRSYSSTYVAKAFHVSGAYIETWDANKPATLIIYGDGGKVAVSLPGVLRGSSPDRCMGS